MKMLLTVEFDGGGYCGWQAQRNLPTVQETLTKCASETYGRRCLVTGCSRTDSGVHAKGYRCTVEFAEAGRSISDVIPVESLPDAMNAHLQKGDISVIGASVVGDDFHPRYSAKSKTYEYIFYTRRRSPFLSGYVYETAEIDDEMLARMNAAAERLVGRHDFAAFMSSGSSVFDTERTIYECRVRRCGDFIIFSVCGDGFLYNMVRIMAGTLLEAARGKISPDEVTEIIMSRDRGRAGPTLPPHALFLTDVEY